VTGKTEGRQAAPSDRAQASALTRDRVAGLALAGLGLVIAWEATKLPLGGITRPGPGLMPLMLAVVLAAAGLLLFITGRTSPSWRSVSWFEAPRALAVLAAAAFGAFALEQIGFRATMFLIAVFLLAVVERKPLAAVLVAALILSFGTHYLFSTLLKVPLPQGPWGF
jgi:putative tricarboxylic transport membrane protein